MPEPQTSTDTLDYEKPAISSFSADDLEVIMKYL